MSLLSAIFSQLLSAFISVNARPHVMLMQIKVQCAQLVSSKWRVLYHWTLGFTNSVLNMAVRWCLFLCDHYSVTRFHFLSFLIFLRALIKP